MFKINSVDTTAQEQGIWKEYDGSKFLIASGHNPKFAAVTKRIQKPFERQIQRGTISPEQERKNTAEALAEAVLLDWENVESEGEVVEYSKELAAMALLNDPEFRDFVIEVSIDVSNYKKENLEATTKKSAKP